MPIYIKSSNPDTSVEEWSIVELQGDLELRGDAIMSGQFVGDLLYNKFGHPVLIIGHHILHGKCLKIEKPFVLLEKKQIAKEKIPSEDNQNDVTLDLSQMNQTTNATILDSTIAIKHKTVPKTEYVVRAIITNKLVFKSRPKPIITNVAKQV